MKCDLCKREVVGEKVLCETCADTIRRLIRISQRPEYYSERPLAARATAA